MKMKKFTVNYSLYDLNLHIYRNGAGLFDSLEELVEWMHNQPYNVVDIKITDIYEHEKVKYVPYKKEGS